jgi:hypothetical protein
MYKNLLPAAWILNTNAQQGNMLTKERLDALRILTKRLSGSGINWAVFAGTNLELQGVDVQSNDIDILVGTKEDVIRMGEVLKRFETEPIQHVEKENYDAYEGKFKVNGIDVQVIGELVNKVPGGDLWSETKRLSARKTIIVSSMRIPVISLAQEYSAYLKMGKLEKAEKIFEAIQGKTPAI